MPAHTTLADAPINVPFPKQTAGKVCYHTGGAGEGAKAREVEPGDHVNSNI